MRFLRQSESASRLESLIASSLETITKRIVKEKGTDRISKIVLEEKRDRKSLELCIGEDHFLILHCNINYDSLKPKINKLFPSKFKGF